MQLDSLRNKKNLKGGKYWNLVQMLFTWLSELAHKIIRQRTDACCK
jgi:hypothetical protein